MLKFLCAFSFFFLSPFIVAELPPSYNNRLITNNPEHHSSGIQYGLYISKDRRPYRRHLPEAVLRVAALVRVHSGIAHGYENESLRRECMEILSDDDDFEAALVYIPHFAQWPEVQERMARRNKELCDKEREEIKQLSDSSFIKHYEHYKNYIGATSKVISILEKNNFDETSRLIKILDEDMFFNVYPYMHLHYEAQQLMLGYYQMIQGLKQGIGVSPYIYSKKKLIEKAGARIKNIVPLTPVDENIVKKIKKKILGIKDPNDSFRIGKPAQKLLARLLTSHQIIRITDPFDTYEQRNLQDEIITGLNDLGRVFDQFDDEKIYNFFDHIAQYGVCASELNHMGQIDLGQRSVRVLNYLTDFSRGFCYGAQDGIYNMGLLAYNVIDGACHPKNTYYALRESADSFFKAAKTTAELIADIDWQSTGKSVLESIEPLDIARIAFFGPPQALTGAIVDRSLKYLSQQEAEYLGHMVGDFAATWYVPGKVFKGAKCVVGAGSRALKNARIIECFLENIPKSEQVMVLACEMGPMEAFGIQLGIELDSIRKGVTSLKELLKHSEIVEFVKDFGAALGIGEMEALQLKATFGSLAKDTCSMATAAAEQISVLCKFYKDHSIYIKEANITITEIDFFHIFLADFKVAKDLIKGGSGLHHDPGGLIQKAGQLFFKMKDVNGPFGIYSAYVGLSEELAKFSSFFPKDWSRAQVIKTVIESFATIIERDGNAIFTRTSEGLVIKSFIEEVKVGDEMKYILKSAFPDIEKTLKYLANKPL